MTSTSSILAKHIHSNDDPHKLTAVDAFTVRCWTCGHNLDLTPKPAPSRPSSTSLPMNVKDPAACAEHLGQVAGSCGPCRSERIAQQDDDATRWQG